MGAVHHPNAMLNGEWSQVSSSNVIGAKYEAENELLFVQYKDGSTYQYLGVSLSQAAAFAEAPSAGTWIWDNLRQRGPGNKDRTQVPFIKM